MNINIASVIYEKYTKLKRPLILDGAIGSYLEMKHIDLNDKHTWMTIINSKYKEEIINLYEDYINSGADIITTNTFRTNPLAYIQDNLSIEKDIDILTLSEKNVGEAVKICIEIRNKHKDIFIAGSNGPAEDCYSRIRTLTIQQLEHNHINHINFLYKHGADFIINETMSHFDEIKIVADHCEKMNYTYAISLYFEEDLRILSGEPVIDIIEYIQKNYTPLFISFNCITISSFRNLLKKHKEIISGIKLFGFYINCGDIDIPLEEDTNIESPKNNPITTLLQEEYYNNLFIIGTCCMSDPNYTKLIFNYYYYNNK